MNNKQVLFHGFLESTIDLRSIFVGHIHLRNLRNFEHLLKYFTVAWPDSGIRNKFSLIWKNMGQCTFKKPFEFHNFSEIFYCGMTRLRNMKLSVFILCQYTRTILRNKNMGQSLIKEHSKFQNFDDFTVAWSDSETWVWMFLYSVSTQEPF